MSETRRATRRGGWWCVTGWERCAVCAARLDREVVIYCVACDEPLCPLCVVEGGAAALLTCRRCGEEEG